MKTSDNCFSCSEINQRENNEDYCLVFPIAFALNELPITVLIVADGMGGHEHGEEVSRQAVLKMKDFLDKSVWDDAIQSTTLTLESLEDLVYQALESTNHLVQRMVETNGWKRAGSTIVVAAVWRDQVVAANLGDSPLFHYRSQQHTALRVTQDHSVTGILVQANLITEQMARYHERRGQLEYFLGTTALPTPKPLYHFTLEPGDLLLLCSDGISGSLELEQITAILDRPEFNLAEKARQLIEVSRSTGETDNQTLILWRYGSNASSASAESLSLQSSAPLIQSSSLLSLLPSESPPSSLHSTPATPTNLSTATPRSVLRSTAIEPSHSSTSSRHRTRTRMRAQSFPPKGLTRRSRWQRYWQHGTMVRWGIFAFFSLGLVLAILLSFMSLRPQRVFSEISRSTPPPSPTLITPRSEAPSSKDLTDIDGAVSSLRIDRFEQNGRILYTLDRDTDTSQTWQVESVSGDSPECQSAPNVPPDAQKKSLHQITRISIDRQKIPRFLVTQSEQGCIHKWSRSDVPPESQVDPTPSPQIQAPPPQKNLLDKLKTFFETLISRIHSKE